MAPTDNSNQDATVADAAVTNVDTAGEANLPPPVADGNLVPNVSERISDVQTTNLNNENAGQT